MSQMPEFNPNLVSPEDFLGIAQNRIKDTEAELRRAQEKSKVRKIKRPLDFIPMVFLVWFYCLNFDLNDERFDIHSELHRGYNMVWILSQVYLLATRTNNGMLLIFG